MPSTASQLLIVQDDSGVTLKANTYADPSYFADYCAMLGKSMVKTAAADPANNVLYTDDEVAVALMAGRRYMDTRWGSSYVGVRAQEYQTTEWPRDDAFDNAEYIIYGITDTLRDAQCEYSYLALTGVDLNPVPTRDETGQKVQRKTTQVGPILDSVTYVNGGAFALPVFPAADTVLKSRGYVVSGSRLVRS